MKIIQNFIFELYLNHLSLCRVIEKLESLSMEELTAADKKKLTSFHRILLHTNGTVTEVLREWTGFIIHVTKPPISLYEELKQYNLYYKPENSPSDKIREVILQDSKNKKTLVYAISFIQSQNLNQITKFKLEHSDYGIGTIIDQQRLETYREILNFHKINILNYPFFKKIFPQANSLILHRVYNIIHKQKIWFTINEYFPSESDHFNNIN